MEAGKKKMLATLVGCNYAGTENELQGCINDVHATRTVLLHPPSTEQRKTLAT